MDIPSYGSLDEAETDLQRAQLTCDADRPESLLHPDAIESASPNRLEFGRWQVVQAQGAVVPRDR